MSDLNGDVAMATSDSSNDAHANNKFARPPIVPTTHSSTFTFTTEKNFSKQYAAIYFTRLSKLKKIVLDIATASQSNTSNEEKPIVCQRILDLVPEKKCIIAGTLYKDMKLKPCILDEYNKEKGSSAAADVLASAASAAAIASGESASLSNMVAVQSLRSADDSLILEDEYGRVQLVGVSEEALPVSQLASGIVLAVEGIEGQGGKFQVSRMFLPGFPPQVTPHINAGSTAAVAANSAAAAASASSHTPAYILCVSGLSLGAPGSSPLPLQMLIDYITGYLGGASEHKSSSSIVRVLILGNSLHRFTKKQGFGKETSRAEDADTQERHVTQPLKQLDLVLTQLSAALPVDIIPGENDPSTFTLPQQPLHKCMFPSASTYSSFSSTTNPCSMQIQGLDVLVTAGQNVQDLAKYSEAPSVIDHMAHCLSWRNVAPTAPDTLGCYPFQHHDPFVLSSCPHLYIVGNQSSYDSRYVSGDQGQHVRLVTVPSFVHTHTAVLIDINSPTLQTKTIQFDVQK